VKISLSFSVLIQVSASIEFLFHRVLQLQRIVDLSLGQTCRNWKWRTIFIRQSPHSRVSPGFRLIGPSSFNNEEMKIEAVYPSHLWDPKSQTVQPDFSLFQAGGGAIVALQLCPGEKKCTLILCCGSWLSLYPDRAPWCKTVAWPEEQESLERYIKENNFGHPEALEEYSSRALINEGCEYFHRGDYGISCLLKRRQVFGRDMYILRVFLSDKPPKDLGAIGDLQISGFRRGMRGLSLTAEELTSGWLPFGLRFLRT
jgi:hypothetical protein